MHSLAIALPLLPGRTDTERAALTSWWHGPRREAHPDARRRAGITREAVRFQPTESGDVAVVYLEADDLDQAAAVLTASPDPFDRCFRDHVRLVHGIALENGLPTPEQVLGFDVDDL